MSFFLNRPTVGGHVTECGQFRAPGWQGTFASHPACCSAQFTPERSKDSCALYFAAPLRSRDCRRPDCSIQLVR